MGGVWPGPRARAMTPVRRQKRAKRSNWSRYELEKLVWLVSLYRGDKINFDEIANHLRPRSCADCKKRWVVVRDNIRRKIREGVHKNLKDPKDPNDPNDLQDVPYGGELHVSLLWNATQWADLDGMKL